MPNRCSTCLISVVAAVFAFLPLAQRVDAADKSPELDVIVTTNVKASEAFAKAFLPYAYAQAESALYGLSAKDASDGKAKDGAARYRLLVDHKGTVTVGSKLTVLSSFPFMKEEVVKKGNAETKRLVLDKTRYLTTWHLPVKQNATLAFTLLKWDGAAYKTFDTWAIPSANGEWLEKGLAEVAKLEQDATKPDFKLGPACPITPEQARDEGFLAGMPAEFGSAFAARWAKGKFDKLTPQDGEVYYDVSVENKAPWPLERIYLVSTDKDESLLGYVEFKPAIAPGKTGKGKGSCFVAETPKKAPGLRVTEVLYKLDE